MSRLSPAEIVCYILFGEPCPALCELPNVCIRPGPGLFECITSATKKPIGCWPFGPNALGEGSDLPFALWSAPEYQQEIARYLLGGGFIATNFGVFVDCSVSEEQIAAALPQEEYILSNTIWSIVPGIVEKLGWAAIPVNPDFTMLVFVTSISNRDVLNAFRKCCDLQGMEHGTVSRMGKTVEVSGLLTKFDVDRITAELKTRLGYNPFCPGQLILPTEQEENKIPNNEGKQRSK